MAKQKTPFQALPGFIICKVYIPAESTFVSEKEVAGDSQMSEVVSVGGFYKDDHGIDRISPVKEGDIILHKYTSDDLTINFDRFRVVHFSNIMGVKV